MKLAVVFVHYHTAELAVTACEALAADLRQAGLEAERILVDNGSSAAEREVLSTLDDVRLLEPGRNLGYAGGANLGVRATDADALIVANPDVEVLPGCTAALLRALERGSAAGPRFYWDRARRFLLPPNERRTRRDELLRLLGERGALWARVARRRWRRHVRRLLTAPEPRLCHELSGALLAFRREAWEELEGFDEGYRLYFEGTDFLERLRRRGRRAFFVPQAEAVHLYAQSTIREPRSEGWFVESSRRFRRRFYGGAFTAFLEGLDGRLTRRDASEVRGGGDGAPAWLEVSAAPVGFPAALRPLTGAPSWELPEEITARLPAGTYHLRTVDGNGRGLELRTRHFGPL